MLYVIPVPVGAETVIVQLLRHKLVAVAEAVGAAVFVALIVTLVGRDTSFG
jgi:hypothetical protein